MGLLDKVIGAAIGRRRTVPAAQPLGCCYA
jgi:hypothetical protein